MKQTVIALMFSMMGLVAGCSQTAMTPTRFPDVSGRIAVPSATNHTGMDLSVSGASMAERYLLHTDRETVGDVLAAEVRAQLESAGATVVDRGTTDDAFATPAGSPSIAAAVAAKKGVADEIFFIEIRRWNGDEEFLPRQITVALMMSLVEVSSGRVLWAANYP
jgi:hypothetical protein